MILIMAKLIFQIGIYVIVEHQIFIKLNCTFTIVIYKDNSRIDKNDIIITFNSMRHQFFDSWLDHFKKSIFLLDNIQFYFYRQKNQVVSDYGPCSSWIIWWSIYNTVNANLLEALCNSKVFLYRFTTMHKFLFWKHCIDILFS